MLAPLGALALGPLPSLLALLAPPAAESWNCTGTLVPPVGYRQETAFAPTQGNPNAKEDVEKAARQKLVQRLCEHDCMDLAAKARTWKTGEGAGIVCSMAVIEEKDYSEWLRALTAAGIEKDLADAVAPLLANGHGEAPSRRHPMLVVLDKVVDEGVAGGQRAQWLRDLMLSALRRRADLAVAEAPRGWAGEGVPKGAAAVLLANAFVRREGQRPMLEVLWRARVLKEKMLLERAATAVRIPLAVAPPKNDPVVAELPKQNKLSIRIEASASGSLCPGQKTQLYLNSTVEQFVQVFDVYGKGEALLIFPSAARPDGLVRAGETIPIGPPEGLQAVPVMGSEVERFVVLGAASAAALGPTGKWKGICKISAADVAKLVEGKTPAPGVVRASDGFRISQGAHCKDIEPPSPEMTAAMERALAGMAECK